MENRVIRPSRPEDVAAIRKLHSEVFGPGRFARTAYRVREAAGESGFGLTAWRAGELVGAVQFTPITIGGRSGAMMLGPLAVAPQFKGQGFGRRLVEEGVTEAQRRGAALVVLVGDLPYYARMDFGRIPPGQITLPGPVAPERLLVRELCVGARSAYAGQIAAEPAQPSASQDYQVSQPTDREAGGTAMRLPASSTSVPHLLQRQFGIDR